MPKFNMYQALHTTVIGPEGRPLEIQIRTREMHETAEYGVAAHWTLQGGRARQRRDRRRPTPSSSGCSRCSTGSRTLEDPQEFVEHAARSSCSRTRSSSSRPRARSSRSPRRDAAGLRLRGPHRRRPPLRRREGQRQDRAAALRAAVRRHRRGADLQARARPVARLARGGQDDPRAQQDPRRGSRPSRARTPSTPAASCCRSTSRRPGLPAQKITGSPLLADVIREMGFRKADDFYIALGGAKISPKVVVNKVMQRLKAGRGGRRRADGRRGPASPTRKAPRPPEGAASQYGIRVEGVDDVLLRLAKCCRPVPGDQIVGYISLGRGITIHREDCPNAAALRKDPERFVAGQLGRRQRRASFRVELQVDGWDRHRLLEDLSRTFAEAGHQHPRGALHRHPPDGPEPLRRRGRRHADAQGRDHPPAQRSRRSSTPTASRPPAAESGRGPSVNGHGPAPRAGRRQPSTSGTGRPTSSWLPDVVAVDLDGHRAVVEGAHDEPVEPVEGVRPAGGGRRGARCDSSR